MSNKKRRYSGPLQRSQSIPSKRRINENLKSLLGTESTASFNDLKASSPVNVRTSNEEQLILQWNKLTDPEKDYALTYKDSSQKTWETFIVKGDFFNSTEVVERYRPNNMEVFCRFNPLSKPKGSGWKGAICDRDILDFRFLLQESDSLPLETQSALLLKLMGHGLPISSIVYSGGKSLHSLIKLEQECKEDSLKEALKISNVLVNYGFDPTTKNPSRMTRLAGCFRNSNHGPATVQELLYLNDN